MGRMVRRDPRCRPGSRARHPGAGCRPGSRARHPGRPGGGTEDRCVAPRVETNKRHLPRRATRLSVSLRWPARAKTGKIASALRMVRAAQASPRSWGARVGALGGQYGLRLPIGVILTMWVHSKLKHEFKSIHSVSKHE